MESAASIQPIHRKGNLHIELEGQFTATIGALLASRIREAYRGQGNIFIHTARVTEVSPDSRMAFSRSVEDEGLPSHKLFLLGDKGLEFSPDTVRVIIAQKKKKRCGGRCRDCRCRDKH